MIEKVLKIPCVILVWSFYFMMIARAFNTGDPSLLIVSILWSFAALMVFPIFKGGVI